MSIVQDDLFKSVTALISGTISSTLELEENYEDPSCIDANIGSSIGIAYFEHTIHSALFFKDNYSFNKLAFEVFKRPALNEDIEDLVTLVPLFKHNSECDLSDFGRIFVGDNAVFRILDQCFKHPSVKLSKIEFSKQVITLIYCTNIYISEKVHNRVMSLVSPILKITLSPIDLNERHLYYDSFSFNGEFESLPVSVLFYNSPLPYDERCELETTATLEFDNTPLEKVFKFTSYDCSKLKCLPIAESTVFEISTVDFNRSYSVTYKILTNSIITIPVDDYGSQLYYEKQSTLVYLKFSKNSQVTYEIFNKGNVFMLIEENIQRNELKARVPMLYYLQAINSSPFPVTKESFLDYVPSELHLATLCKSLVTYCANSATEFYVTLYRWFSIKLLPFEIFMEKVEAKQELGKKESRITCKAISFKFKDMEQQKKIIGDEQILESKIKLHKKQYKITITCKNFTVYFKVYSNHGEVEMWKKTEDTRETPKYMTVNPMKTNMYSMSYFKDVQIK